MQNTPEQKILFETTNATLHLFANDEKDIISTNNARISQIQNVNDKTLHLSVDTLQWIISNEQTVARLYPRSGNSYITYIFTSPTFNGVYTLTLSITLQAILKLEATLSKSISILDFPQAMQNEQFSSQINKHCPYLEHQMFGEPDKCQFGIKWTGKTIASGFKFVGSTVAKGVEIIGTQIQKRVSEVQKKPQFTQQTKKKWSKVKQGTSAMKSLAKGIYSNYIQPIAKKGTEFGKKLSNKMETSKISQVRYAKCKFFFNSELAACTGEAILNVGKGAIEGTKQIGGQIGTQTKKIINKKYGNNFVDTCLLSKELSEEANYEPIHAYFGQSKIHNNLLMDNLNTSNDQNETCGK